MDLAIGLWIIGLFVLLTPFITFCLLLLKGLPSFAVAHAFETLLWVYQITWIAGLLAGAMMAGGVSVTVSRTGFFHRPYDFGRSFSLGAILGALCQGLATGLYRVVVHKPFSSFWIAGAMLAGCLTGGAAASIALWKLARLTKTR